MKLQHACWAYMVRFFTKKDESIELLEAFQELDKNHDGYVSKEELINYCNKLGC